MKTYYNPEDLKKFGKIGEFQKPLADKFFDYYGEVFAEGALTAREKFLIALAVAHTIQCPYCIDAYATDTMEKLIDSSNPLAAAGVMCRNTISVGWDGYLYDCDFNPMLELKVTSGDSQHIRNWNERPLTEREIIVKNHFFGCTAGAGSSCGGTTA